MYYIISSAAIVISLIFIFTKGFTLGVDFKGGRTYVAKFNQEVSLEEVRNNLNASFGEGTEVKTYGGNNQLRITTGFLVDETNDAADDKVLEKLNEGLDKTGVDYEILSSQKVGPTIANDLKTSAFYSVIFAILGIGLYILFRFKKWEYSVAAAVGLVHDAIVVLGIFSIFDGILPFEMDMNQSLIAAILTVVAYSINDTVVVFDRLREYLGMPGSKKTDHAVIINEAINRTLSRTIITSLTVIFVIAVLFIFGGEVIRGFSFAILIGIILGTYSSIFLSAPLVYDLEKGSEEAKEAKAFDAKNKTVKA
jgi:SecD/SecF fusion protein